MGNIKVLSNKVNTNVLGFGVLVNAPLVLPLLSNLVPIKGFSPVNEFDGVDDYVEIEELSTLTEFYVEIGCNISSTQESVGRVGIVGNIDITNDDFLGFNVDGDDYYVEFSDGSAYRSDGSSLTYNEDIILKYTYDGTTLKIYENDIEVGSGLFASKNININNIGKSYGNKHFEGNINYVKVWSDATQTTLIASYDLTSASYGKDQVTDLSGQGNHGTSFGKAEFSRSTDGTFTDHNGVIQTAGIDIARHEGQRWINDDKGGSEYIGENAIKFDNSKDEYIDTNLKWINGNQSIKLNFISYEIPTGDSDILFGIRDNEGTDERFYIWIEENTGYIETRLSSSGDNLSTGESIELCKMYEVTLTYNKTTNLAKMYVNGVFIDSVVSDTNPIDINYFIGAANEGDNTPLDNFYSNQIIDNIIIWNEELTGEEAFQQYQYKKKGLNYLVRPENVVSAYKLDDNSSEIIDYVSDNNGTFYSDGVEATPTLTEGVYSSNVRISNDIMTGVNIERQSTNLFLNSDAPVTQTITVLNATEYTLSVLGTGSITLSGGGSGTATEGTNVTFTTTSTSITCTITGDLDYAQVEQQPFGTSQIITEGVITTRTKDLLKYASDELINNDFSMILYYTPNADDVGTPYLFGTYVDVDNYTAILHDGTNFIFRKRISATNYDSTIAVDYSKNTTYKIGVRASSTTGLDIFVGGVKGTNNSNTTNSQLDDYYEIGSNGNGSNQCDGKIKNFKNYTNGLSDSMLKNLTL